MSGSHCPRATNPLLQSGGGGFVESRSCLASTNNRIHHRQVVLLLLQFAAARSLRERAPCAEAAWDCARFPSLPSAIRRCSDQTAGRPLQAWQPIVKPDERPRMRLKLRLALRKAMATAGNRARKVIDQLQYDHVQVLGPARIVGPSCWTNCRRPRAWTSWPSPPSPRPRRLPRTGREWPTVRQKTSQLRMIPSGCGCSRIAAEAAKLGLGWLLNAAFQGKPTKTNCQPRHWLAARLRLERAETDTSAVVRRPPDRPALDGMVVPN